MAYYDGSGSGAHDRPAKAPKTWNATCVDCGAVCRVPFDPSTSKARCRECFEAKKAGRR